MHVNAQLTIFTTRVIENSSTMLIRLLFTTTTARRQQQGASARHDETRADSARDLLADDTPPRDEVDVTDVGETARLRSAPLVGLHRQAVPGHAQVSITAAGGRIDK